MKILAVLPHFTPDAAPTGVIGARLVEELGALGHHIEVVTSLPWYAHHAVEPSWQGKVVRRERTPWGVVTRVHPFPTGDKKNIPKRAVGFAGFCALTAAIAAAGRRVDVTFAMTPPLPMAATGWLASLPRRAPLVLNVQDVFPDVAVELGVLRGQRVIAAASALERWSYARSAAVTVLSEDMRANLAAKMRRPSRLHVIPNFVDVESVRPMDKENSYRAEYGLSGKTVVMYAGNVGMSQSLDLLVAAARAGRDRDDVVYVVNGGGSTLADLQASAADLPNLRFVPMQPYERLPEVLAAADVHVVPLKRELSRSSVPSKTYSILAAGRPVLASVDEGSEVQRIVEAAGAGVAVPPEDERAFVSALSDLVDDVERRTQMEKAARAFVENAASPRAVAEAYESLFKSLIARGPRRP
ncbi:MAG TPA: glycosyltransferase family 4 protein [Acidothermaceae bacterium]